MLTRLIFFRHAVASGNKKHLMNGSKIDSELTKKGREQAKKIAMNFSLKPDIILSSPLKRARQTAYYFEKKYKLKAEIVKELEEQDFGKWSGKNATKIKKLYPKFFMPYSNGELSNYVYFPPGGESYFELKKRVRKIFQKIKKEYKGKVVFIFCHGVVMLAILEIVTKIKPPKLLTLSLKNGSFIDLLIKQK
ncbi:MAG: histidine phosphatase family protein [Candidatus Anstonellaceae archaeon]